MSASLTDEERDLIQLFQRQVAFDMFGLLRARGFQTVKPTLDPYRIALAYENARHIVVTQRPRAVHLPPGLLARADSLQVRAALESLLKVVRNGSDLRPYQSKEVRKAFHNDALFNDWGIVHLHLTWPGQQKRGDKLLFARVERDAFYVIEIGAHGLFTEQRLIETAVRSWPDAYRSFEIQGWSADADSELRDASTTAALRKSGFVTLVQVDGRLLAPPGGGTSMGSLSSNVSRRANRTFNAITDAANYLLRKRTAVRRALEESSRRRLDHPVFAMSWEEDAGLVVRELSTRSIHFVHAQWSCWLQLPSHRGCVLATTIRPGSAQPGGVRAAYEAQGAVMRSR